MNKARTLKLAEIYDCNDDFEPLSLDQCLKHMPLVVNQCRSRQTFQSAVEVCDTCRTAWAAYLQEWSNDPHRCDQSALEAGLTACLEAVRSVVTNQSSNFLGSKVRQYEESIAFRLHLAKVLHSHGAEAAKAQMKQRQQNLARRRH